MEQGKTKLVIFDFDGVIMDTEWAHEKAKRQICSAKGYMLPEDLSLFVGRSNLEFWSTVLEINGVQQNPQEYVDLQYDMALQMLAKKNQPESQGLTELLTSLKNAGQKSVICSGSGRNFILYLLEQLRITSYFAAIIGGDQIRRLKPEPDIFLAMLDKMQVEAKEALVVEDSASGCLAAKRAGIPCVAYLNEGRNRQNVQQADFTVNHLSEVMNYVKK